jgi:hypothetical protein
VLKCVNSLGRIRAQNELHMKLFYRYTERIKDAKFIVIANGIIKLSDKKYSIIFGYYLHDLMIGVYPHILEHEFVVAEP